MSDDSLRGAIGDPCRRRGSLTDVGALLDQKAAHQPALGSGLVRHERHPQDLRGVFVHLVERLRHLDAAALAAASGVDLRLDHPYPAAEAHARPLSTSGTEKHGTPLGVATPKLAQDLFALIFVNIHDDGPRTRLGARVQSGNYARSGANPRCSTTAWTRPNSFPAASRARTRRLDGESAYRSIAPSRSPRPSSASVSSGRCASTSCSIEVL